MILAQRSAGARGHTHRQDGDLRVPRRAKVVGITWPIPAEISDAELERLFTPAGFHDGSTVHFYAFAFSLNCP